ncbi:hypothetical protein OKA05_10870 [Luteolibacter arcticus]|uniref:DUF2513 domain-containing protein n=1 Tax=Luteolibacter arcticus TaxID=1581411 RepID=A0ABT3GHT4_9BACT|nr:Minf_1886 family protein [Luteolibacter arcticus]MCW1923056.1 hypothetical protein [Luteolibacter arcticus]
MKSPYFEDAVEVILEREKRYDELAYYFLKEALNFTFKRVAEGNGGELRHVTGKELSLGFRDLALQDFGQGAAELMRGWGVHGSADVGEMVFLLIDEWIFGKQDSDTKEDFADVFAFDDAIVAPPHTDPTEETPGDGPVRE